MFSVNNFYAYLQHRYANLEKNNILYAFETNGSRNVYNIVRMLDKFSESFKENVQSKNLMHYYGSITALDQEPINKDHFYCNYDEQFIDHPSPYGSSQEWVSHYTPLDVLAQRLSKVYTPVICHSEKNSEEVKFFCNRGFIDVHYWYHGLIARDWYRHWKHYTKSHYTANRLGCYIRDTSGTREYRKDVLELIRQENIFCPLLQNKVYNSDASAMLEWADTEQFDIHIVAETMFDTLKTHLTEKVLKPVAMEQPFILFAGPNSLQYMRDYGFQTFESCWDESYDEISDSPKRLQAVSNLIKYLNSMPADKYKRIIKRAKLIAQNNREHFYSQKFEDLMLNELDSNMQNALQKQHEDFFSNPGGLYFSTANELRDFSNDFFPKWLLHDIPYVLKHIKQQHPSVAKQIVKQYPDLF
jgi:hypothetical protein